MVYSRHRTFFVAAVASLLLVSGCKAGSTASAAVAPGSRGTPTPMYSDNEVAQMRSALMVYQDMVRKDEIDPQGAMYKPENVPQAKDLADNFLDEAIRIRDSWYNRPIPGPAQREEQGRWLFEKEVILEGLRMMGEDGAELRKKMLEHYLRVSNRVRANRPAIDQAWRFPLRWPTE